MQSTMIVAVTGASGHIGNCLVRELVKTGTDVRVLVHKHHEDIDDLDIKFIYGNILDPETLTPLCKNVDVVFHCAALISIDNQDKKNVYATNVTGTKNMVEASLAAGVKKFIHFSSIDAFATYKNENTLNEKSPLAHSKKTIYGYSKAECEKLVLNAVTKGLDAVILSPTAVIGPCDFWGSSLGSALLKFYNNKIPILIPLGYNWVDVRDVVSAAIQSVKKGRKGEKYILSGNFCSLKDLSGLIENISGKTSLRLIVPVFFARLVCPLFHIRYLLTKRKPMFTCQSLKILIQAPKNISFEKAQKELDYSPRPLEQTLRETFEWYKQNKYLNQ